jgi:hypothetical protein
MTRRPSETHQGRVAIASSLRRLSVRASCAWRPRARSSFGSARSLLDVGLGLDPSGAATSHHWLLKAFAILPSDYVRGSGCGAAAAIPRQKLSSSPGHIVQKDGNRAPGSFSRHRFVRRRPRTRSSAPQTKVLCRSQPSLSPLLRGCETVEERCNGRRPASRRSHGGQRSPGRCRFSGREPRRSCSDAHQAIRHPPRRLHRDTRIPRCRARCMSVSRRGELWSTRR